MSKKRLVKKECDHVWQALEYEKPKARYGATVLIGMESLKKYHIGRMLKAREGKPLKRFKNRKG